MMYKRFQMKRIPGWQMPPNSVYVGRPSKWGNPYPITERMTREKSLAAYRIYLDDVLKTAPDFLDELKRKDLVCWCPPHLDCHADILIEKLKLIG